MSALSEAEKEAILRAEYYPSAHRIGLVTSLIHVAVFFLPALYLTFFHGLPAEYTLDAKNRLTIPPKFRGALSDGVVLAKEIDPCISIWPVAGWLARTERILADRDELDEDTRDYRRLVHAGAYEGQLDAAGRIMLPQSLIDRVSLDRDVSLIGNLDVIEVWDRERWAKRQPELDAQAAEIARRLSRRNKEGR